MRKILIAINNPFFQEAYSNNLRQANFNVLEADNGKDALEIIKNESPELVIADTELKKINGFEILKKAEGVPVIIFTNFEKKEEKEKAIDLNAKDFIAADTTSPHQVVLRVKIAFGEQKSYRVYFKEGLLDADILLNDLGYANNKCLNCGSNLALNLVKDMSKNDNFYRVSIICPGCYKPLK